MRPDIFFLLIEYSGIPIALMVYSIIIKELSNSDPIPVNKGNDSIWLYGVELLVIISVSTLLYAISFFGHTNGDGLTINQLYCVIVTLMVSIGEFFILAFLTSKVKFWGKKDRRTKIYPNITAGFFLITLIILIIACTNYSHPLTHDITSIISLEKEQVKSNNTSVLLIIAGSFIAVAVGIFYLFNYLIWRIRKKTINDYNIGSRLINNDPILSVKNLQDSLKRLPDSSPLIIDIYMKLARIYVSLEQNENALIQIEHLENTNAFKNIVSYLKDGITKTKFEILISLGKLDEAEALFDLFQSKEISNKLKIILFEKQKSQSNNISKK